ncbi:MAG: RNA polymerase subunit sigma-70, partial [Bacteroides sp.]|nr:RNA polymerase subunit sigma-70 [Bacteroides sp.]
LEEYISYTSQLQSSENITTGAIEFDQFEKALQQAKTKLSPRQREVFEMNKEQNLSIADIAEKLSITEQVVRNQLSAALKIIRMELTEFSAFSLLIMLYNI